jgi:hypothetical protein
MARNTRIGAVTFRKEQVGTAVKNQGCIHQVTSTINSGMLPSIQFRIFYFFRLLSKETDTKMHRSTILTATFAYHNAECSTNCGINLWCLEKLRSKQNCWKVSSSGMWRRVDLVGTDVSEKRIASIFKVEDWDTFLRNVGSHKFYRAPHPRRRHSS